MNIEHSTLHGDFITVCPLCGCREFFVRKDFPQKLGLALVMGAAVAFLLLAARPGTFYVGVWVLLGVTVLDALLYLFVPRVTTCYRCRADFRGRPINPAHEGFELAVAEKYRGESGSEKREASSEKRADGSGL